MNMTVTPIIQIFSGSLGCGFAPMLDLIGLIARNRRFCSHLRSTRLQICSY